MRDRLWWCPIRQLELISERDSPAAANVSPSVSGLAVEAVKHWVNAVGVGGAMRRGKAAVSGGEHFFGSLAE